MTLAVVGMLAAPLARGWTYQDGDVLLIFRESGFNDVEFDLGNISQFVNAPGGSSVLVTNWDVSLTTNTFGSDLTGVSVILAATTSRTNATLAAWLSSANSNLTPLDVTPSAWQAGLWSPIDSIGTRPSTYLVPAAGATAYSIDPEGTYALASYDQIVSDNGVNLTSLAEFGGNASFPVEQVIPGTFTFWEIQPSIALPKPQATQVGSFTITAGGGLTFTAGTPPLAITITGFAQAGAVSTVTFNTSAGGNYWLAYTNGLNAAATSWPLVAGPVAGNGNNQSLSYTNLDANGFYQVVRTP
jgi:hypothetical protein